MRVRFASFAAAALAGGSLLAAPARAEGPRLPDGLPYFAAPTSLGAVAKRFSLRVDDLATLNDIADRDHFNRAGLVLPLTPKTAKLPRFVAWTPAEDRRTCAATAWTFAPRPDARCDRAFCARGPQDAEACACFHREGGAATISLRTGGGPIWRAELPASGVRDADPETFDVTHTDLDQDGQNEVLISWLDGVSNGIAAESRTLVVVRAGREVLRYDSGALTASNAAVLVDGRCHLASAHFAEVNDPIRGGALHLVERTFDPIRFRADAQIVARRFSDRTRFVLPFDPEVHGKARGRTTKIVDAKRDGDGSLISLALRSGSGGPSRHDRFASHEARLGDARRGRLLPPALVWPALSGAPVRIARAAAGEPTVLWLAR